MVASLGGSRSRSCTGRISSCHTTDRPLYGRLWWRCSPILAATAPEACAIVGWHRSGHQFRHSQPGRTLLTARDAIPCGKMSMRDSTRAVPAAAYVSAKADVFPSRSFELILLNPPQREPRRIQEPWREPALESTRMYRPAPAPTGWRVPNPVLHADEYCRCSDHARPEVR
jgi:hypothetical protein